MSLKDRARARARSGDFGPFEPLDLNERNVDMIYSRCKASEEEIKERKDLVLAQSLMVNRVGRDSELSVFTGTKLDKNKQSILYLLGQMEHSNFISSIGMGMNYNHDFWTNDTDKYVYKLSDLGIAIDYLNPFELGIDDCYNIREFKKITPTLSPNDPNFAEWYKGYERDVLKKSEGIEPEDK